MKINIDMEKLAELLDGMTSREWTELRASIDSYFSKKVAKLKVDDLEELKVFLNRKII